MLWAGSSREYVAELVRQYDLVVLQETWLFPWDLALPSTGVDASGKSSKQIFGMLKPSKFNVGWNARAKELNAGYREAVSHWNIAGLSRSGILAELKCRARAAFRHEIKFLRENEDQLGSQSMLSKLQRRECIDFWKEIKPIKPKKEFLPLTVGGTSGESNIANLWKDYFSAIANSVGSTDNRDQVMNALRAVPLHNDVVNVH